MSLFICTYSNNSLKTGDYEYGVRKWGHGRAGGKRDEEGRNNVIMSKIIRQKRKSKTRKKH